MHLKLQRTKTSTGSRKAANHVFRGEENAEIVCVQGIEAELHDMMDDARKHGSMYGLRQFILSPAEEMTRDQALEAFDMIAAEYGIDPDEFVIVEHMKARAGGEGFERHWHGFTGEVDVAAGRVREKDNYKQRNSYLARAMEDRFGHQLLHGSHSLAVANRFENEKRPEIADRLRRMHRTNGDPKAAFSDLQHQIAKRQGFDLPAAKVEVRNLWKSSDSGQAFKSALEDSGYSLAHGRKAGLWVVQKDNQLVGSLDRLTRTPRAEVTERLACVQPTSQAASQQPDSPEYGKHGNKEARAPSTPSVGHGGYVSAGATVDAPDALVILDSDDPLAAEKALKRAAASEKKRHAALASTSTPSSGQEAVEAAHRIASLLTNGGQNGRTSNRGMDRPTVRTEARREGAAAATTGISVDHSAYDAGRTTSLHSLRGMQARRHISNIPSLGRTGSLYLLQSRPHADSRATAGNGRRLDSGVQPVRDGAGGDRGRGGLTTEQQAARNLMTAKQQAIAVLADRPKTFNLGALTAKIDKRVAAKVERLKRRADQAEKSAIVKVENLGAFASLFRTAEYKAAQQAAGWADRLRERACRFEIEGRYTERRDRLGAAEMKHRGQQAALWKFDNRPDVRRASKAAADVTAVRALCRAGDQQMISAAAQSFQGAQKLLRQREQEERERLARERRLALDRQRELEQQQEQNTPKAERVFGPRMR